MDLENGTVRYDEEYIVNSRGLELFTCKWLPANKEPKALIFLCHGYAMECCFTMQNTAIKLVKEGFAVYGIDYEGHGKSSGLKGYISSFDNVVDDCFNYFTSICEKKENKGKMRFFLGESMGGAVLLRVHLKKPQYWNGAVLVAPMCQIAEEIKPPQIVISILTKLCNFIPTWKIIPGPDVIDSANRREEIRKQIRNNKNCYQGRARLNTGHELLRSTMDLEKRLNEVSMPFLVVHGEADTMSNVSSSKLLHKVAASSDKTLKLYPGMWHSLLFGEFPENIEIVTKDIINWLNQRTEEKFKL